MSYRIDALKNSANFPEKSLWQTLFGEVASYRTTALLKNTSSTDVTLGIFRKFSEKISMGERLYSFPDYGMLGYVLYLLVSLDLYKSFIKYSTWAHSQHI